MKISEKTKTFAQSNGLFILTNEENLTFENLDILKHKGWLVNTVTKTISPYLPIGVLTKSPYENWKVPEYSLVIETLKEYKYIG